MHLQHSPSTKARAREGQSQNEESEEVISSCEPQVAHATWMRPKYKEEGKKLGSKKHKVNKSKEVYESAIESVYLGISQ